MSDIQAKLGRELLKTMVDLRTDKGGISLEDVGGIFMQLAGTINPSSSTVDNFIHAEIGRLASYITDAKTEIFAMQTNEKAEDAIMDASAHLDEVIKHTEEATNNIMDAADQVQEAASGVGGDSEQKIMDATHLIYDACTFQDITGQRIRKVIKLLENIEERVNKLNEMFGDSPVFAVPEDNPSGEIKLPKDDAAFLNGPQLGDKASSQEDIDKLFASLGGQN